MHLFIWKDFNVIMDPLVYPRHRRIPVGVQTFEILTDREDIVVDVHLNAIYFVGNECERTQLMLKPNADPSVVICLDLWRDCWCSKPESVCDLWKKYLLLRRFTLPTMVFERKLAYWRCEEQYEMALRTSVSKRLKMESGCEVSADSDSVALAEQAFAGAECAEEVVRNECAAVLAMHMALCTRHEAVHGKRGYAVVEVLFPLTRAMRRLSAYARNEATRSVMVGEYDFEL